MAYDSLTETMKTLVMFQYENNFKILIMFLLISLSFIYLVVYKKYESKSPFWTDFLKRIIFTGSSFITLIMSPFMLLLLDPSYSFWLFLTPILTLYGIFLTLILITILIDFIHFSTLKLAWMGGLDVNSKNYDYLKRWCERYLR